MMADDSLRRLALSLSLSYSILAAVRFAAAWRCSMKTNRRKSSCAT